MTVVKKTAIIVEKEHVSHLSSECFGFPRIHVAMFSLFSKFS